MLNLILWFNVDSLLCRRCNFLLNNVIDKVLFLTRRKEKYLVVAAVRFMRTLISRNVSCLLLSSKRTLSVDMT